MRVQTLRGERGGEQARLAIRHWGTGILLVLFQPPASFRMFRRNAVRRRPRRGSLRRAQRVGWPRFPGGQHVVQKGSLVAEDKLRFDFTCNTSLTKDQIKKIEFLINDTIRLNLPRTEKLMPVKDAVKSGAIALFGEKYPEKVRVISFQSEDYKDAIISKELCGGTHVNNTGQIGFFKILSDSSVASGVRRIEAITGEESEIFLNKKLVLSLHL